jgi:hypothetical protein
MLRFSDTPYECMKRYSWKSKATEQLIVKATGHFDKRATPLQHNTAVQANSC